MKQTGLLTCENVHDGCTKIFSQSCNEAMLKADACVTDLSCDDYIKYYMGGNSDDTGDNEDRWAGNPCKEQSTAASEACY